MTKHIRTGAHLTCSLCRYTVYVRAYSKPTKTQWNLVSEQAFNSNSQYLGSVSGRTSSRIVASLHVECWTQQLTVMFRMHAMAQGSHLNLSLRPTLLTDINCLLSPPDWTWRKRSAALDRHHPGWSQHSVNNPSLCTVLSSMCPGTPTCLD